MNIEIENSEELFKHLDQRISDDSAVQIQGVIRNVWFQRPDGVLNVFDEHSLHFPEIEISSKNWGDLKRELLNNPDSGKTVCSICGCVMLADTEDWKHPLCPNCFEELKVEFGRLVL